MKFAQLPGLSGLISRIKRRAGKKAPQSRYNILKYPIHIRSIGNKFLHV
jgi:hypothetical protein